MKRFTEFDEKNNLIMLENKAELQKLESFYVEAKYEDLDKIVENKKKEIVGELIEFQDKYVETEIDRNGNEIKIINPYLVSTYFFKSINPLSTTSPKYSAEKLAIVWDLYMYLVEQVNMNISIFQPTLTHFAKFAGISLKTLNGYKESGDENMQTLCDKIWDECFNGNISLAQTGKLKEKTTLSRLKIENQIVEKEQPKVNVNVQAKVDLDEINKRLKEIKSFNSKVIELEKERG